MKVETITIGNTTITAEDIGIVGVNKMYDINCNQYIHSVEIQTTRKIVNDNGYIDVIHHNVIHPCSIDEYDKFKEMLYG